MTELKKEFEEKFCYEMMNFDHTNRHHYIVPNVIEKPQIIIDWIEQKIDETCKRQREICADEGRNANIRNEPSVYEFILKAPSPKESDNEN